jgi:hypothetical protein
MKKKPIFKLQTYDWNKLTPKEQDKAIVFLVFIINDLATYRKSGLDNEFWAQYP